MVATLVFIIIRMLLWTDDDVVVVYRDESA